MDKNNGEARLIKIIILIFLLIFIICGFALLCFNFYINKKSGEEEANNNGNVKVIKSNNFEFTYDYVDYPYQINGKTIYTNKVGTVKIKNEKKSKVAKKIDKDINERILELWENIENDLPDFTLDDLSDEDIEMMSSYGLSLNIEVEKVNDSFLQFNIYEEGGFGGTAWMGLSTYCYSTETGNLLSLNDLTNNYDELYDYITNAMINFIKNSSYYDDLIVDDWEEDIKNNISNQWYLSDNGLVLYLQKYEITAGVAGMVEFTISYNDIDTYFKDEYQQ